MKKFLKRFGKTISILIGITFIGWLMLVFWPIEENPGHPFFREDDPDVLVIAHRGGEQLWPENTMVAFENVMEMDVDILEYDVHITADGELVVVHDDTVDRTTDSSGRVNDHTLEEIQQMDAGYHFTDLEGEHTYRGEGVQIPTVREVLESFPETRHLIELKNTNDVEVWDDMAEEMWRLVDELDMHDNVMIASFSHEINEYFQEISDGTVAIGAGVEPVRNYVIASYLLTPVLYNPNAEAFQVPTSQVGIDLTRWPVRRAAEARNIPLYYWTINDTETMEYLIDIGADGIMTDRPDLLLEVLDRK